MDYETIKAHKRARRAAMRELQVTIPTGHAHRSKKRYTRKAKHKVNYAS